MKAQDDLVYESLAGPWQLVRAELDAEHVHELVTSNTVLILGSDSYEVRFSGEVADLGTVKKEITGNHPALVLSGVRGPNAGRTIRCIYQTRGAWLRICYGMNGVLPDAFTTAQGTQRYLATYKRAT